MKEPWEWEEEDLLAMIANEVQESLILDYKQTAALSRASNRHDRVRSDLSKDVSAMANAAGGTLVYGVREQGHRPVEIDSGYDPQEISREWLEQSITSNIRPRIEGLRINPVALRTTHPERIVYVVYVPQSTRAHMANDHRYYKRYEFEAKAMEEYEVRDVMNRGNTPNLVIEMSLIVRDYGTYAATTDVALDIPEDTRTISVHVRIKNTSSTPAEYGRFDVWIATNFQHEPAFKGSNVTKMEGLSIRVKDEQIPVVRYSINWHIAGKMPIWGNNGYALGKIDAVLPVGDGLYVLAWDTESPRMEHKEGYYHLKVEGNKVSLESFDDIV